MISLLRLFTFIKMIPNHQTYHKLTAIYINRIMNALWNNIFLNFYLQILKYYNKSLYASALVLLIREDFPIINLAEIVYFNNYLVVFHG